MSTTEPPSSDPPPDFTANDAVHRGRLRFTGELLEMFAIHVVNMLLTIVTLGVYRFWAKTRMRRYLWSNTAFLEDRFEYTGTGKELLLGFIIVISFLLIALGAYGFIFTRIWPNWLEQPQLSFLFQTPLFLASLPLINVARFRARRYRLSRTRWRGIRGAQTGSSLRFGLMATAYWALTLATLGFYWPYMRTRLLAYKLNGTWIGDKAMTFDGAGDDLIGRFTLCWFLTLPTAGLIWFWYRARALQYYASRSRYGALGFEVTVTGWVLLFLTGTNMILTSVTLGLAYPYVLRRNLIYLCDYMTITGDQDFTTIAQGLKPGPTTGEGMAEAFDIGDF